MNPPRRGFLKALVVAPLAAPSVASPQAAPAPAPAAGANTPVAVDALVEASRALLGARFPAADLAEVKKSIEGNLKAAAAIKAARALANADEPVTAFAALPETMRKARGGRR